MVYALFMDVVVFVSVNVGHTVKRSILYLERSRMFLAAKENDIKDQNFDAERCGKHSVG